MTHPNDPQQPADDNSSWAAYEPTQVSPQVLPVYGGPETSEPAGTTAPDYGTPGYGAPDYGTPDYGAPQTPNYSESGYPASGYAAPGYSAPAGSAPGYPAATPYAAPYPGYAAPGYPAAGYPPGYGVPGYTPPAGPAPQTAQVSSVISLVISGLLVITCYGALAGIAPLVLSILGVTKASSVDRLWMSGQAQAAQDAAAASKKLAMWAWIALAIGVVVTILVIIGFVVWISNVDTSTGSTYGT